MRLARLAFALCCCLAVVTAGAVAVVAAPPPQQLCGVCGPSVANDAEIAGATGHGTLDITIDEAGDSRWQARVPVSDAAADRYRGNATALEAAVDDAWATTHAAAGDVRDVESSLEGDTVVVNYAVDGVARQGVGETWLVDYFADVPSNARYEVAAERVTIHTPEGTVVTNDPAYASVEGDTATWTRDDESASGDFSRQTYVTYGPDGVTATASGYATIGLEEGPDALEQGVTVGIVPVSLVGLAGLAVGRVDWGRDAFDSAGLERLVVAVGTIGAVGLLAVSAATTGRPFSPGVGALSALGVGYAALGIAARRRGVRRGTRGVLGIAALATLGTGALLWLLGGPVATLALPFALATALFLPIGYAFEDGPRPLVSLALVALAAFTLLVAAVVLSLLLSPSGLGVVVYWILLAFWAGVVVTFGYPLALTGRRLADTEKLADLENGGTNGTNVIDGADAEK